MFNLDNYEKRKKTCSEEKKFHTRQRADHEVSLLNLRVCSEMACEQDICVKYEEDVVRAQHLERSEQCLLRLFFCSFIFLSISLALALSF